MTGGATEQAPATEQERISIERLGAAIDSVYFLMFDGWEKELESNRWHFARRWARHVPVTLLQPRQGFPRRKPAVATQLIDNCEVLPIAGPVFAGLHPLRGLMQGAQVMAHMEARGHVRPLLWSYNPELAPLYAALPAVARVYHASENYFDYDHLPEDYLRQVETTLRLSDLVVAVSSGVAEGIRMRIPEAPLATVTNGCDIAHYQPTGPPSTAIAAARVGFDRVAVFAGNVNGRIDFELLARAAESDERTLIVIVGPVAGLDKHDSDAWRRILHFPNVRHEEAMKPTELAAVYRSADLGFIPYRRNPLLVRNGFPLKTLEMAATGLPVVASHMEPIVGLASAVAVAEDDEQFLESFRSLSRATISDADGLELLAVAAANDYDRKFGEVLDGIARALPRDPDARTRLDDFLLDVGHESWRATCSRVFGALRMSLLWRLACRQAILAYGRLVPVSIRHRLVPSRLRRWARSHVVE